MTVLPPPLVEYVARIAHPFAFVAWLAVPNGFAAPSEYVSALYLITPEALSSRACVSALVVPAR